MLDDKDQRILAELRSDSKKTTKEIAEGTGIPRTTVHDRVQRMEERGVIRRYTVVPDYEAVGEPTAAFLFVSYKPDPDGPTQREVADAIAALPGVYEVHMISGDWDIITKVRGPNVEAIGELVTDRVRSLRGVGRTVTCAVFRTVKDDH